MKTILVTGAAGFIGSWVATRLLERGDAVVALDNFNGYYDPALKRARAARFRERCVFVEADITDRPRVERLFAEHRFDQVCHLAAQAGVRYSLENPFAYESANNLGTLTLLEACRRAEVKSFIYASSSSVYGGNRKVPFSVGDPVDDPISVYAATKRANELTARVYHHLYGIRCTGLRFFTVYGPWGRPDMALFKFTQAILDGKPIDVYNQGRMRRDFTYITDIVDGVVAALDKDHACELFNLGNSRSVDLLSFVQCLERALGREARKNFLPMQPGDVPETFADIEKSTRLLGFEPRVPIEEGIKLFWAWYQEYHK